jgi:hypothetical protein
MPMIRKRKVRWNGSPSSDVVGYKLYWAIGGKWEGLSYNAESAELGNVTEVILPDDVAQFPEIAEMVEVAVTAVDSSGNESDMVKISTPFKFSAPDPPTDLVVEVL